MFQSHDLWILDLRNPTKIDTSFLVCMWMMIHVIQMEMLASEPKKQKSLGKIGIVPTVGSNSLVVPVDDLKIAVEEKRVPVKITFILISREAPVADKETSFL
jgi:hypothetical protein